jgi:hypothetical protein
MIKTGTRWAVYGQIDPPNKTTGEQDHERNGIWKISWKEMWGRKSAELRRQRTRQGGMRLHNRDDGRIFSL